MSQMDSPRHAAYRRALELLQERDAQRLSAEQRELVRDHAEDLLLRRGPALTDEVEETGQSAAFLVRHLTAAGLLSRRLATELESALSECAPSSALPPEARNASATGHSFPVYDDNSQ